MSIYERPLRFDELLHYGVMGMRWGVRRYQNPDGTLTSLGKSRMENVDYDESTETARKTKKSLNYLSRQQAKQNAEAASSMDKYNKYTDKGKTEKAKAYLAKMADYTNRSKEIGSMMDKTIAAATKKGQNVKVDRKVKEFMYTGAQIAGLYGSAQAFGLLGWLATNQAIKNNNPGREQTYNRYKVNRPKN